MEPRLLFNRFGARLRAGPPMARKRRRIKVAHAVLRGSGIEIGALHNPIPVSPSMTVTYVDRLSNEGLREHYPEIPSPTLVTVDIVDEAESLDLAGLRREVETAMSSSATGLETSLSPDLILLAAAG